ncbi:hypothetical protein [Streptococcus massiliensis]|uniref:Uncharacterized protein n=1 Tax=Streptococcus massiliensis TaxID=313439 RepID=A0A380L0D1_9STRE|nr:hypothetical protein [Streptococcus massiliensis]SUN77479.1 Uncharacterised protein [Streptococcus massiliensis]
MMLKFHKKTKDEHLDEDKVREKILPLLRKLKASLECHNHPAAALVAGRIEDNLPELEMLYGQAFGAKLRRFQDELSWCLTSVRGQYHLAEEELRFKREFEEISFLLTARGRAML